MTARSGRAAAWVGLASGVLAVVLALAGGVLRAGQALERSNAATIQSSTAIVLSRENQLGIRELQTRQAEQYQAIKASMERQESMIQRLLMDRVGQ